jgi:ribonuclease P protein component
MVPRSSRIPFREFRAHGYQELATPYFSVKAKKNSFGRNRFGVIVGISSVKTAARRNFFRRQAKSVFLTVPQKRVDLLVFLRPGVATLKKKYFRKTLSSAIATLIPRL